MGSIVWIILFWLLLTASCGYALARGGRHERVASVLFLAATIASIVVRAPLHERYVAVETTDLIIDIIVLGVLVQIALSSDRFWPLWTAGLQLTISMSHLLKWLQPDLMPLAYAAAQRFWSYPILLILLVGAWRHHRRERHLLPAAPAPA